MGSVHCSGVVGTQGCQMQDAGLSAGLEAHLLGPLALPMHASQAPPAARLQGLTHLVPATLTPDGDSTTSGTPQPPPACSMVKVVGVMDCHDPKLLCLSDASTISYCPGS